MRREQIDLWVRVASLSTKHELAVYSFSNFITPENFSVCFPYESLTLQIDFDAAADFATIGGELTNQQTDPNADNESVVVTNDNGLRWPLIPFPEDWYASV